MIPTEVIVGFETEVSRPSLINFVFKHLDTFILDVCPSPPGLAHGSHDGSDFRNGENVTYSCNPKYVLEGSAIIRCKDGRWLGQIPVCRGIF